MGAHSRTSSPTLQRLVTRVFARSGRSSLLVVLFSTTILSSHEAACLEPLGLFRLALVSRIDSSRGTHYQNKQIMPFGLRTRVRSRELLDSYSVSILIYASRGKTDSSRQNKTWAQRDEAYACDQETQATNTAALILIRADIIWSVTLSQP